MTITLVCPDGHTHAIVGRNVTDSDLKKYEKCPDEGCGKTMQRMGGTPPVSSPTSSVQQF